MSRSPRYRRMLARLRRFATTDESILLSGETGCGKTRLARLIHEISPRRGAGFRPVDLGCADDALINSELFGHMRGSFTGACDPRAGALASVNHGTLFLDELGKASIAVQKRLMTVIESKNFFPLGSDRMLQVDVRFLLAANESFERLIHEEKLLSDLFHRIKNFVIEVPALRERIEDLPVLLADSVATHSKRFGYLDGSPSIADDLVTVLSEYAWPGNLRELDLLARRLLCDAEGAPILERSLLVDDLAVFANGAASEPPVPSRDSIQRAIKQCNGNLSEAARLLGIGRTTLYRWLRAE